MRGPHFGSLSKPMPPATHPYSPLSTGEYGSSLLRNSFTSQCSLSGPERQVMASKTNLRHRNVPVAFLSPHRYLYPCFLTLHFLSITQNRYKEFQSSRSACRGYSTRARNREINKLREGLYVDTNKVFDHVSRAGLEVRASSLMKAEDLGGCFSLPN
jgi:hypothetical protein